jgi:hypothetical protein
MKIAVNDPLSGRVLVVKSLAEASGPRNGRDLPAVVQHSAFAPSIPNGTKSSGSQSVTDSLYSSFRS